MSDDFAKYIELTPIETIIKHELFYQLNSEKEMNKLYPEYDYVAHKPAYWKITFESNDKGSDGFYHFFGSKSPHKLFTVYKQKL